MVLSFPNQSPMSILTIFLLGLMRIAPIVAIAPFLGAKLPGSVKMALAIGLTAIILPHLVMTTTETLSFNMHFIGYALKELLMGMILAMFSAVPFFFAQSAGVLIDFLRGSSALMITDPFMQAQVSPIGILYNYVLVVLFFQLNGPFIFLDAVYTSYTIIPLDGLIHSAFFNANMPFWKIVTHLLTDFMAISIQLSAPSLLAILMAEMFLGIANRLAPQVQIAFLGLSIKSLMGLALLCFGWFFILQQLGKQSLLWLKTLEKILQAMRL
ncbi:MAG TPA: flagellar biosynthetic protein FliR [Rhabdochlamydiaceae bacterium]|nr:flagellar biosynthetic protein FliR [Rhabdochlamydiaceae bacterium]